MAWNPPVDLTRLPPLPTSSMPSLIAAKASSTTVRECIPETPATRSRIVCRHRLKNSMTELTAIAFYTSPWCKISRFMIDGSLINIVKKTGWKRDVRRILFTSKKIIVVTEADGSFQFGLSQDADAAQWYFHFQREESSGFEIDTLLTPSAKRAPRQRDTADSPVKVLESTSPSLEAQLAPIIDKGLHGAGESKMVQTESPLDATGSFQSLESRELKFPGM